MLSLRAHASSAVPSVIRLSRLLARGLVSCAGLGEASSVLDSAWLSCSIWQAPRLVLTHDIFQEKLMALGSWGGGGGGGGGCDSMAGLQRKQGIGVVTLLRLSALQANWNCPAAVSACIKDPPKTAQRPQEHQELALVCSKLFVIKYFMTIQMF